MQKILNNTVTQLDLISHLQKITTAEHIFFSSTNGTFSRMGHRQGHKINFSKCQKTTILQRMFSDDTELSQKSVRYLDSPKYQGIKHFKNNTPQNLCSRRRWDSSKVLKGRKVLNTQKSDVRGTTTKKARSQGTAEYAQRRL